MSSRTVRPRGGPGGRFGAAVAVAVAICAAGATGSFASDAPHSGGILGIAKLTGEGDELSWRGQVFARGERPVRPGLDFYLEGGITTNVGTDSGKFFEFKPNQATYDVEVGLTRALGDKSLDILLGHMSRHDIDDSYDGKTEAWNTFGFRLRRGVYGPWLYSCANGGPRWQWSVSAAKYVQTSALDYEWDLRAEASRKFKLGPVNLQGSIGARLVTTDAERSDGHDWFLDKWGELGFRSRNPEDKYVVYLRWEQQHDLDRNDGLTADTFGVGVKFFW